MTERDPESMARERLERLVAETVSQIREAADKIERDARGCIASAVEGGRTFKFHYTQVAAQSIHAVQTLVFNLSLGGLVDAAADAEKAYDEKRTVRLIKAALAVADENRDGDTTDGTGVSDLVREAQR